MVRGESLHPPEREFLKTMSNKKNKLVAHKDPEVDTTTEGAKTDPPVAPAKAPKAKKEKAAKPPKEPRARKEKPVREIPAHMAKVQKFAAKLPSLTENAMSVFTRAEKLTPGELNVLSAHVALLARTRATATAGSIKFKEGDPVRIHSGVDTRFIGQEGVVTKVQRIRIFVKVSGFERDAYVFASNCEPLNAQRIDISEDAPESTDEKSAAAG